MNLKHILSLLTGALLTGVYFIYVVEQSPTKPETPLTAKNQVEITPNQYVQSPSPNKTPIQVDDSESQKIAEMQAEIDRLNNIIASQQARIDFMKKVKEELAIARSYEEKIIQTKEIIESKMADSQWSNSQIEEVYPAPFDQVIKKSIGPAREAYQAFQYEPVDQEWALVLETKIRDFFTLNEFGHLVEIKILECKTYHCQLGVLVPDPKGKPWKRIFDQMTLEPWFAFHQYSSSPIVDREYKIIGNLFFLKGLPQIQER